MHICICAHEAASWGAAGLPQLHNSCRCPGCVLMLACEQAGAGYWLTDEATLRATAERLAKDQFSGKRDPADAALQYMALGKRSLLQVSLPALAWLTVACLLLTTRWRLAGIVQERRPAQAG